MLGDFNINVLDPEDHKTKRFRDILASFGLIWSLNSPTRVTATSESAIDNIITNCPNIRVSVVTTAIADHYAQEITVWDSPPDKELPFISRKRDVRSQNISLLNCHLAKEKWSISNIETTEEKFITFNNTFLFHLNNICPVKTSKKTFHSKKCSWITPGILVSRERLKFLSAISKQSQNEELKAFVRRYKNIYRAVIKAAKAYDISKSLKKSRNISKTVWNIIKSNQNPVLSKDISLEINNKIISSPAQVTNVFNKFFSTIAEQSQHLQFNAPNNRPRDSMVLSPVSERAVANVIQQLHSKRTNDTDYMSTWLLKKCSMHTIRPLTEIINSSFNSGVFPSPLKVAKVIPVHKKDDPLKIDNYRPISILPILSKVFEKLFLNQLLNFLDKYKLLSKDQFGFRPGMSTTDAVVSLVERIVEGLENREHTLSVFLDLSKAFDCVDHTILLQKLEHYGVRGVPLLWLKSYLCNRTQSVEISNHSSSKINLKYGVPQGSILSPLLFLIYVNDVGSSLLHGQLVQYADDTTLLFKSSSKANVELESFIDLNSCIQHFEKIKLKTNAKKSNFLNFCMRPCNPDHGPSVMIGDSVIEEADTVKFLGIYLDRGLTWNNHVNSVCAKVSSGLFALRKLSKYCPRQVLLTAYFGLIYPHLSYGITIWGGCSSADFSRLFRLQKKAIRLIANLKQRESCKPAFIEWELLTLPCLYIVEVISYCMSKCTLIRGVDVHNYQTRGRNCYRTRQHRTVIHERLPSQAGVVLFNSLPDWLKDSNTPMVFKTRLKKALRKVAFYSVGEFLTYEWENGEIGRDPHWVG